MKPKTRTLKPEIPASGRRMQRERSASRGQPPSARRVPPPCLESRSILRFRALRFGFQFSGSSFGFRVSGFGRKDRRPVSKVGRVSGFGFRVSGFGSHFRDSGFGFRVSGFGFRVSGFSFGFRFRVSGFGFQFRVSDFWFRVAGFGFGFRWEAPQA